MKKPSYLAAAFNARPLGMPIPPNWFGIAAFGLLGALVNPGLWLIGLGLEGIYLWSLSRNQRFRNTVDADPGFSDSTSRYENMLASLDHAAPIVVDEPRDRSLFLVIYGVKAGGVVIKMITHLFLDAA